MQMPNNRNGKEISHNNGASTITSNASGQQMSSRINQAMMKIRNFMVSKRPTIRPLRRSYSTSTHLTRQMFQLSFTDVWNFRFEAAPAAQV